MPDKDITYRVDIDARAAQAELKRLGREAKAAGDDLESAFDDSASAGEKARAAILSLAKVTDAEMRQAAIAAEALSQALGEDLAGKTDVNKLVTDLNRMGVEFTEITADADKFATTIKQIDDIHLQQVTDGVDGMGTKLRAARGDLDEVSRSAGSSKSALANMVGNTTQDLGEMGGIVGSLGVGIGQMGEYMADAAFEGEKFSSVLKNFAGVAGPIAGLAIATQLVSAEMGRLARREQWKTDDIEAFSGAIEEAGVGVDAIREKLEEAGTFTVDFLPDANFIPLLEGIGVTADDLAAALNGDTEAVGRIQQAMQAANIDLQQQLFIIDALTQGQENYATAAEGSTSSSEFFATSLRQINNEIQRLKIEEDPFSRFGVHWGRVIRDLRDGHADLESTAESVEFLAEQLGIDPNEVISLALEKIGDSTPDVDTTTEAVAELNKQLAMKNDPRFFDLGESMVDGIEEGTVEMERLNQLTDEYGITAEQAFSLGTQAVDEHNQKMADAVQHALDVAEAAAAINDALAQTPDFAAGINAELDKVDSALAGVAFDANFEGSMQEAIDGLAGFEPDLQTLADRWGDILAGVDIDILGNVRADDAEAVAAIQQVADIFQTGVVDAFASGGTDAANAFVTEQAAAIAAASGLDISEVYRLMGLPPDGSIQTLIQPTIDADASAKAAAILDAIAGTSDDPRIAAIQIQMATGELSGQEALDAALAVAQDWADDNHVEITATTDADAVVDDYDDATRHGYTTAVVATDNADDVESNLDDATADRTALVTASLSQLIGGVLLGAVLDYAARPRTATISTQLTGWQLASALLSGLTQPRTAHVRVVVDNYLEVERQLDQLTRNRTATINTRLGGARNGASV